MVKTRTISFTKPMSKSKQNFTFKQYYNHVPSYLRGIIQKDIKLLTEDQIQIRNAPIEESDKNVIKPWIKSASKQINKYFTIKYPGQHKKQAKVSINY